MISRALTNRDRRLDCTDHVAFVCAVLIRLRACMFLRPQHRSLSPRLLSYVCGRTAPYLGVRGMVKSNKSHGNELNESADYSAVCTLSYAKSDILKWGYLWAKARCFNLDLCTCGYVAASNVYYLKKGNFYSFIAQQFKWYLMNYLVIFN